jgi:RNA polymerase sigma factor (sigma-70 family)
MTTIKALKLTEESKKLYERTMASATAIYPANSDPLELRNRYLNGESLDSPVREALASVHRIESDVIAGYIRIVFAMATKFWALDRDDCVQEGAAAIFRAMYRYDGRRRFSTFSYVYVRNALLRQLEAQPPLIARLGQDVGDCRWTRQMEKDEDVEHMMRAIESAPLTDQERAVVDFTLEGKTQREIARKLVKPRTKKKYAHQSVGLKLNDARRKLRRAA